MHKALRNLLHATADAIIQPEPDTMRGDPQFVQAAVLFSHLHASFNLCPPPQLVILRDQFTLLRTKALYATAETHRLGFTKMRILAVIHRDVVGLQGLRSGLTEVLQPYLPGYSEAQSPGIRIPFLLFENNHCRAVQCAIGQIVRVWASSADEELHQLSSDLQV
jgi:hypothetical protein